jgi:UDP-N-acetylmuramate dehydrogenase
MTNKTLEKTLLGVKKNVLLKNFTTYKIGGPAKYFFVAKSRENLVEAVKTAKDFNLPIFILGGGSNLLISDKGFKGLVIKIDISIIDFKGSEVFAGAGADLTRLALLSAERGLSGLEWAPGIPRATVGGAIYGNAQAFGTKISDIIKTVEVFDVKTFKTKSLTKSQCQFSLKNSIFKKNKNLIIVSAILEFDKKDRSEIKKKIKENINYRKTQHPVKFFSAGSTFVNPEIKIKDKQLLVKFPELIEYNKKGVIPAGYLITKCGLAGKKIGGAQISEKHANFILNIGGSKAKDVLALINTAQKKVKNVFGVDLVQEVQMVGL